ncbi:MAG: nucleotidyltransferase domain-containing protein [Candidatus Eisenbacteria bacterium]|nr:nucleotidyltransferase domain-containing protein [Candidatus Eisenbacteria bacterium]
MQTLLEITRSKVRRDLLRLYFTNVDEEYYLRQLERLLGFSAANIRRDLLKLKETGLFKTRAVGNLVFYSLNKDYPLCNELKSIVFKTIGVEGSLKKIVNATEGVEVAMIYGSFAAGEETGKSDIDLLIIGEPNEEYLMAGIDKLERDLRREINYTIYSKMEYKKRKRKNDSFIRKVLTKPKIMLEGSEDDLR